MPTPTAQQSRRTLALTEAERAEATRKANALLGVAFDYTVPMAPDGKGGFAPIERTFSPVRDGTETTITTIADEYQRDNELDGLNAQERSAEHALHHMRRRIEERRELLANLCRPAMSRDDAIQRASRYLCAIGRKRSKIDKAIFVAATSDLLKQAGMSDWARRWTLAAALCPTTTERREVTRSAASLDRLAKIIDRLVREGAAFMTRHALMAREPAPSVSIATPRRGTTAKPDLRNRLKGTRHDAASIRALIAQLPTDQQIMFCRAAEYDILADEIAIVAADDQKSGLRPLPPVIADALELVGRSDCATRRMLGRTDNKTRDLLVSDWLQEYADEQEGLPSLPHFSPARIKAVKDFMRKAKSIVRTTEVEIDRELKRLAKKRVES